MGSYAELWTSNESSAISDAKVLDAILFKWSVPLGWLALFEPNDFIIETEKDENEDVSYENLYSSTTVPKAIKLLSERSGLCAQVAGNRWEEGCNYFINFLTKDNAQYVHVSYQELIVDDSPVEYMRQYYIGLVKSIAPPVFVEKRNIFLKKTLRLATDWKYLTPYKYKKNADIPLWAWFGSPPRNMLDWDDLASA